MGDQLDNHVHALELSGYTDVPAGKVAAIVTFLEMFDRPTQRPEAHDLGWSLTREERPDLSWYRELFRRVGEPHLWMEHLRASDERLRAVIHDTLMEVYAFRVDGRDEGLLVLDFRIPRECEVLYFGLTEAMVGTGAGRWMMNRAIERAWSAPIVRFWVHTCTLDHPSSVAFYMRSGFVPYATKIELLDDPRISGLLSRKAAPHVPIA
jgi:GNAT superfamily N-acetyltransferase